MMENDEEMIDEPDHAVCVQATDFILCSWRCHRKTLSRAETWSNLHFKKVIYSYTIFNNR